MKEYLVFHHSATPDGVLKDFDAIKRYHIEHNGWRDIGYMWVVERVNGVYIVTPGRKETDVAAACPGRNMDGIHVCVVGNYEIDVPSAELYQCCAGLTTEILARNPSIHTICGHRDVGSSVCPGKNFDVNEIIRLVKEGDKVTVEDAIEKLVSKGIISSPNYWLSAVGVVKYLDNLLINIAGKL